MKFFFLNGGMPMRLIEISVFVLILPLFFWIFSSDMKFISESGKTYSEKAAELSRDRTIARGFVRLCEQKEEARFDSFRSDCASLFALDSISVEKLGVKDKKTLLKCSWSVGETERAVIAIKEEL